MSTRESHILVPGPHDFPVFTNRGMFFTRPPTVSKSRLVPGALLDRCRCSELVGTRFRAATRRAYIKQLHLTLQLRRAYSIRLINLPCTTGATASQAFCFVVFRSTIFPLENWTFGFTANINCWRGCSFIVVHATSLTDLYAKFVVIWVTSKFNRLLLFTNSCSRWPAFLQRNGSF